jgi:transcriptional regulator with XRE-family HTH domain
MTWQEELGETIRRVRKDAGLSQDQLASKLSVSREQLSNYENGKSSIPVNVMAEIVAELKRDFVIRGCRITLDELRKRGAQAPINQLCFTYDKEHRFENATLTIKPTAHSVLITAVAKRLRRA